jgi:hypothetical protein
MTVKERRMRRAAKRRIGIVVATTVCSLGLPVASAVVEAAVTAPPAHAATTTASSAPITGGAVVLGQQMNGNLETVGDIDRWTVAAPTGFRAFFQVNAGAANGYVNRIWNLHDSHGRVMFSGALTDEAPLYLPADPGGYTLAVTSGTPALSPDAGPYSFTVSSVPTVDTSGGTITIGNTVNGNLEAPGAVDSYSLPISATSRVYIQATAGCGCRRLVLRDASKRVLLDGTMSSSLGPVALAAGTYSVTVSTSSPAAAAGSVGTYSFKVLTMTAAQPAPNFPNAAFPLNAVAGTLATPLSEDIYSFTPTSTRVTIHLTCGFNYALYGPAPSKSVLISAPGCDPDAVVDLPIAGLHTIAVSGVGAYNLSVQSSATAPTPVHTAPITVPASGASTLVSGNLTNASGRDMYTFAGTAGQQLYVQAQSGPGGSSQWDLRGPSGGLLSPQFEMCSFCDLGLVTLPETGSYALRVLAQGTTGPYSFDVWNVPAPATPFPFAYNATTSAQISNGSITDANGTTSRPGAGNIEVPGAQDVYSFAGNAGDRITLRSTDSGQPWQLRDPDGFQVASGVGLAGLPQVVTLAQTGTYTLALQGQAAQTQTYSFTAALVPLPLPLALAYSATTPATVSNKQIMGANGTTSPAGAGNIGVPGEEDLYTFTGVAGQLLFFDMPRGYIGALPLLDLELIGPDGFQASQPHGDLIYVRLPRSGTYSIVATTNATSGALASYTFSIYLAPTPDRFDVSLPLTVSSGVINGVSGAVNAGAGNLETQGASDEYSFQGTAGQRVHLVSNDAPTFSIVGPDGFTLPEDPVIFQSYVLPRDGTYTLLVRDSDILEGTRTYAVSLTADPPVATSAPHPQTFDLHLGDQITPDSPQPGEGVLEQAGAEDVYLLSVESGDAADIQLLQPIVPPGGEGCLPGNFSRCCPPASATVGWNLRDAKGEVVFEHDNAPTCDDSGPIVFSERGTYTLTILASTTLGGTTQPASYFLNVDALPTLQEGPQPGQTPPPPQLTRTDPPSGSVGGTTSFDVYGSDLPLPTAVQVSQGSTQLPVVLNFARAVPSDVAEVAANAQVDLTSAMQGTYTITVTLTGGGTLTMPFTVGPAAIPSVTITGANSWFREGELNQVSWEVSNPSTTDFHNLSLQIQVPDNAGPVALVNPHIDPAPIAAALTAQHASSRTIATMEAALASIPAVENPDVDANGHRSFVVDIPLVPSGGSVPITFRATPPVGAAAPALRFRTLTRSFTATDAVSPCHGSSPTTGDGSVTENGKGDLDSPGFVEQFITNLLTQFITPALQQIFPEGPYQAQAIAVGAYTVAAATTKALSEHVISDLIGSGLNAAGDAMQGAVDAGQSGAQLIQQFLYDTAATTIENGEGIASALSDLGWYGLAAQAFIALALAYGPSVYRYLWSLYESCDPNALVGPGTPTSTSAGSPFVDGGAVHSDARFYYTAEFENDGSAAAQTVHVRVPINSAFEASSLRIEGVTVNGVDIPMSTNAVQSNGSASGVPVDGTTTTVSAGATVDDGILDVNLVGPWFALNQDPSLPNPHHGDMLDPNAQGSVRFSLTLDNTRALPAEVAENAGVAFDESTCTQAVYDDCFIPTNQWTNEVVLPGGDVPIAGNQLKIIDSTRASSNKLTLKLIDPHLRNIADPRTSGMMLQVGAETYNLPASGWTAIVSSSGPTQYVYRDRYLATGPIQSVKIILSSGKVDVEGRGIGLLQSLTPMPTSVDAVIFDGGVRFCAHFGGRIATSLGKRFAASKAPAPAACL